MAVLEEYYDAVIIGADMPAVRRLSLQRDWDLRQLCLL